MHDFVSENQLLARAACDAIAGGDAEALAGAMRRFQQLFDSTAAMVRAMQPSLYSYQCWHSHHLSSCMSVTGVSRAADLAPPA